MKIIAHDLCGNVKKIEFFNITEPKQTLSLSIIFA